MVSFFRPRAPGGTLRPHAFAFFTLAVALVALCNVTHAQSSGDIVVGAVHGTATATMAGSTAPLAVGAILQLPATIRTGADGAVELRQGATTIAAAANTELEIPQSAANEGLIERVIQIRGNAFYNVAKREKTRLRVETPYLVAVIKGTQFNVASQESGTTIALFEGRLEVRATDESDVIDLSAGEIAIRNRNDVSIRVLRMTAVRNLQDQPGASSAGDAAAASQPAQSGAADAISIVSSLPSSAAIDGTGSDSAEVPGLADPGSKGSSAIDATVALGAGKAVTAEVSAGIDIGNAVAAGTTVELNAGGAAASVGADVGLSGGNVSAAVDAGVSLGGIDAGANAGAVVDLGGGSVAATVETSAALPVVDTVASAGAAIDLDVTSGANAAVDIGAQGPVATDVGLAADVGLDSGGAGVSLDSGVAAAGSDVSLGLDAAAGPDTSVGVDTSIDTAIVDAGATVDVGAGDVSADVDVGGVVDVGVDLGTGTIDLDIGGGDTGGGLLNGLLNRGKN